jgi:hypothetical protein
LQGVLEFLALGDRPESPRFVGDRANELAMAMPAALANVELPSQLQQLGAFLGRRLANLLLERLRPAARQVLELIHHVGVRQRAHRLFGQIFVHEDRQQRVGDKREQKEAEASHEQHAGLTLKHR